MTGFTFDADAAFARAMFFERTRAATPLHLLQIPETVAVVARSKARPLKNNRAIHPAERAATAVDRVPGIYAKPFAAIQANSPPDVPSDRRRLLLSDAKGFLDRWGHEAERLGWLPDELFGLHPTAPMARYDHMGLLWMLRGECVTNLTDKLARLSGGLAFYRKSR
jgi:hypothetical protein